MQNYTTRQLFEVAFPATAKQLTSPTSRAPPSVNSTRIESYHTVVKMETPTPMSTIDHATMEAPLGTSSSLKAPIRELCINPPSNQATDHNTYPEMLNDTMLADALLVPIDPEILGEAALATNIGKRRVPSASKDEWADSSDDEVTYRVSGNDYSTSEYFRSSRPSTRNLPAKRAKMMVHQKDSRYNRLSGPKQAPPKPLSMSSMSCPPVLALENVLNNPRHRNGGRLP